MDDAMMPSSKWLNIKLYLSLKASLKNYLSNAESIKSLSVVVGEVTVTADWWYHNGIIKIVWLKFWN